MSRTFAYCRVSTGDQTTEHQAREIREKGFEIKPGRIIEETISGSKPAASRPGFQELLIKLEEDDRLVVTKLDRLGRDAIDIQMTIRTLREKGVEVHCIALSGFDLSTAIGEMLLNMIGAFAQFERDLLRERTKAGLKTARAKGKVFGRPRSLTMEQVDEINQAISEGATISSLAKKHKVSRATVMRAGKPAL